MTHALGSKDSHLFGKKKLINIMRLISQITLLCFIYVHQKNLYSLLFLCDICNEVHEHVQ